MAPRTGSPAMVVAHRNHPASVGDLEIALHRCGKMPDTMRSVEMRKRRSEALLKICRRAEDALPYSTLD